MHSHSKNYKCDHTPRAIDRVVVLFTIAEMFKFDFVQDGNGEQTQTVQNGKGEPTESVLTEISLVELVRAL